MNASIQITSCRLQDLSDRQIAAWSAIQRAYSEFDSPFFRHEFSALVAETCPRVEVAVMAEGNRCVGFWPYQRDARGMARPVGLSLSDFQAVIAEPDVSWSPENLVRECGLSAWSFDHTIASQARLHKFHWSRANSPVIDLSAGFDDYCDRKRNAGSGTVRETLRKVRKLEREVGSLRFVAYNDDPNMLRTIFQLKRDQYGRIRARDYLAPDWTRAVLARMAGFRSENFSGMVSTVFAGDQLVGAHLGIRSSNVLHCWFPVFNRQLERYSPGLIFWLTVAQRAAELGIKRIDLGKGEERYKQSLKTGDTLLAVGAVDIRICRGALRKAWWVTRQAARRSVFATPIRFLIRSTRGVTRPLVPEEAAVPHRERQQSAGAPAVWS